MDSLAYVGTWEDGHILRDGRSCTDPRHTLEVVSCHIRGGGVDIHHQHSRVVEADNHPQEGHGLEVGRVGFFRNGLDCRNSREAVAASGLCSREGYSHEEVHDGRSMDHHSLWERHSHGDRVVEILSDTDHVVAQVGSG